MSEENMVKLAQAALDDHGVEDTIIAVGVFKPRGSSGAMLVGGIAGGQIAGSFAEVASGLGLGAGMVAGGKAQSQASGLPLWVHIAVSESTVYGMQTKSRRKEPHTILFAIPRERLTANVHQRVQVRVLEHVEEDGTKLELEGSRLPITHSKDILEILTASADAEGDAS